MPGKRSRIILVSLLSLCILTAIFGGRALLSAAQVVTSCSESICEHFRPDRKKFRTLVGLTVAVFGQLRDNGVEFFPTGGTFIGAVRHGGLIPWDKDADISFLKNDANLKMLRRGGAVSQALVAQGFTMQEDPRTDEFWFFNESVKVEFIPYCVDGNTVVIRCTLEKKYTMSVNQLYPLIWVPWHNGFISIPAKREVIWKKFLGMNSREESMKGASLETALKWIAPTDHSSTLLVSIEAIPWIQNYNPRDWDRTIPSDNSSCCGTKTQSETKPPPPPPPPPHLWRKYS